MPVTEQDEMIAPSQTFREFYELYFASIHNYVFYRVADPSTAEDLSALVFQRAFEKFETYQPKKGSERTWIYAIAKNALRDHYRKKSVGGWFGIDFLLDRSDSEPEHLDRLDRGEDIEHLSKALESLSGRDREFIALKFGCGMNNREIAAETGVTESAVGTALHRAIEKMRSDFGGKFDE